MASTDAPRPTRRQTPDPKGTGGRRPREPKGAKSPAGRCKGRRAQRAHLRPAKSWAALGPSPRFLPFGCRPLGAGAEPQLGPLRAVAAFRPFGFHPSRPAFRFLVFWIYPQLRLLKARAPAHARVFVFCIQRLFCVHGGKKLGFLRVPRVLPTHFGVLAHTFWGAYPHILGCLPTHFGVP